MRFTQICEVFSGRHAARFVEASDALMPIAARGLSIGEISSLAHAIAESGAQITLPEGLGPFTDVPSTGGPASLSTLLCPLLLASEGVRVPKLSARGSISGAIDTMALIPGYNSRLDATELVRALHTCGFAHIEQTDQFCPADSVLIQSRKRALLMASAPLAAASLLGKKLVFPGTAAAFDFRVGPTGNIGSNREEAQVVGQLFHEVAERLGVKIAVCLTDNASFPSSALGRLESLDLLYRSVSNDPSISALDRVHIDTCMFLSSVACGLIRRNRRFEEIQTSIANNMRNGKVLQTFEAHLQAQGAKLDNLKGLLERRQSQRTKAVVAPRRGYWNPPPLVTVKNWIKKAQASAESLPSGGLDAIDRQVGIRLLVGPGSLVETHQPVLEIRFPTEDALPPGIEELTGEVTDEPSNGNEGVVAQL